MTLKIGIPAQNHEDKFGVNINYLSWAYNFGRPVMLMPEKWEHFKEIYKLDAIIIPGGADVNTKRYAESPSIETYAPNIYLEHFDEKILPNLIGKMPIFGICRGLQTLNVFFGGTLRNLNWHPYSNYDSHAVHDVHYNDKKTFAFKVNSFHHQAIDVLGKELTVELIEKRDNVIEAVSCRVKNIFAVQWHPERLLDEYSVTQFKSIL